MSAPEFSRQVDLRQADGRELDLVASEAERAALAERFGVVRIDRLEAHIRLERAGDAVETSGRLAAQWVQSCAISAEDLPVQMDEELSFRFVPASQDRRPDEEVEIGPEECDEIEYRGTSLDLGEAVAQSLALAIDPYATGPEADEARMNAGIGMPEESSPFAVLKKLTLKE